MAIWYMRALILPSLLFAIFAQCGSTPVQQPATDGKLWNDDAGKVRFMLKMTHHLVAPINDACIEQVLGRLKAAPVKKTMHDTKFQPIGFSPLMAQTMDVEFAKEENKAETDQCGNALRSCGTCHLPRVNNCNYRLTIKDKGEFTGKVVGDGEKLKFQPQGGTASEIAPNEIARAEWLDGADDIITWWNFKKLNAKNRIVKKMMALSAKNNVGCTNCHLQHGNFKLNDNGKLFDATGEVNRLVPLEKFLKE